jgi:RNA polymerase sigma-32 factor
MKNEYFKTIKQIPLLKPEEEIACGRRFLETGDREALDPLINSHLRLVPKLAAKYSGPNFTFEDLIAEGNLGLIKAAEKFDPERGFRFSTCARWWITAQIWEFILRNWSLVQVNLKPQKKIFFDLLRIRREMGEGVTTCTPEEFKQIAKSAQSTPEMVELMNTWMCSFPAELNGPVSADKFNGAEGLLLEDIIPSEEPTPEEKLALDEEREEFKWILKAAMEGLSKREHYIFTKRRLEDTPMTLEKLGEVYGITRARVHQIEMAALGKVSEKVLSLRGGD